MSSFVSALKNKNLIFDGGMGTLLQARGLAPGQSPELFGVQSPNVIIDIHKAYHNAGADVVTTNTFGGTRPKLGPDVNVIEVNRIMAGAARKAVADKAFVAGSVGPTGKMIRPLGEADFRELVEFFKEQITGLVQGGVDLILGETHFDLAEARAVVLAAREVCNLPIGISMTFEEGMSLTGTSPLTFVDTMQNMGVDLIASNCSGGPENLLQVAKDMQARLEIPLLIEPNAGLPELENGQTVFRLGPQQFAEQTVKCLQAGAKCVGGCCGTTPEHIKALRREALNTKPESAQNAKQSPLMVVTSRSVSVPLGFDFPARIIGERINPTGKKDLTEQLQNSSLQRVMELAQEQEDKGAAILDVNVGAPLVNEVELLPKVISGLVSRFQTPLCLDSSDDQALKAALDVYPGSPLINSISGEQGKMDILGPVCRDYGAPFILLPLRGRKLPVTALERIEIIESLMGQALDMGIPKRLMLVDALALTVSSKPLAGQACLEVIRYCREKLNLPTVMGLSNISFGLPARELLNSTFMAMTVSAGMCAIIGNPNASRSREILAATEVLLGRDPQAGNFIENFSGWTPGSGGGNKDKGKSEVQQSDLPVLTEAVVKGNKQDVKQLVQAELDKGLPPFDVVNGQLIPGITLVGEKYERREYFLPQLLASAETMQTGFEVLRPLLEKEEQQAKIPVVMATVEGDIHDIGKNIVSLMLSNHGFEVVDLGKDVSADKIVNAVKEHGAPLVGLSALMTTTMVRMQDTVDLIREQGLKCKVMVGGAVLSQGYAKRIGADGYAEDAVAAVKLAQQLCGV